MNGTTHPRYDQYKDSGVEWLRQVPASWGVVKFRHLFRESGEKIGSEIVGPMLSVSGYRGIEIKAYDDENRRRSEEELVGYRIVRIGQLVMNTMWLNYAGLGVSEHEGHVSPAYRAYWIRDRLDRRYVHHLMRSETYVKGYTRLLTGVRPNSLQMGRNDLMDFPILVPPLSEQGAIASFLDRETARIDSLIEKQERLMERLVEKRKALISHAVTQGLNPNVKMKDSGVEWLGRIPEDWDRAQLRRFTSFVTSGSRGWAAHYSDTGAIFVRIGNLTRTSFNLDLSDVQRVEPPVGAEGERTRISKGDVLFSITAYLGSVAVAPSALSSGYVSQHIALVRLNRGTLMPEFVGYVALAEIGQSQLGAQGYGGTKVQLALDDVRSLWIPVPSAGEQRTIVSYLDAETQRINENSIKIGQLIEKFRERRTSLIAAAVTGQIDVREAS